jgi:site-specific recombinase XerD
MKKNCKANKALSLQSRDMARLIYDWHNIYVPSIKTNSEHTQRSYKQSLLLFIRFLKSEKDITPYTLNAKCFSVETLNEWRLWLKNVRKVSHTTCNTRMAAIKSLLEYMGGRMPEYAHLYISASGHIKPMNGTKHKVCGMPRNAIKALLAAPDPNTKIGLRDLTMMMLNYGVAGRLNEILSLTIKDIFFDGVETPYVILHGKGGSFRSIYLQEDLVEWIRLYLKIFHGENPNPNSYLFYSPCHGTMGKLTQPAIAKRLKLYAKKAHEQCPDVPLNLHSHLWRHSMACHWREDDINIVEIKELLGHSSLQSTMIYQDVTEAQKKAAIATLEDTITKSMERKWKSPENKELLSFVGL